MFSYGVIAKHAALKDQQFNDLASVVELYTEDDFRQLVVTAETMPILLGGLCELEDHGESGLV